MITIHTSSLWVGVLFGFIIGIAISFFAAWVTEKESPEKFEAGWDAGLKYGRESIELGLLKEKLNQEKQNEIHQ